MKKANVRLSVEASDGGRVGYHFVFRNKTKGCALGWSDTPAAEFVVEAQDVKQNASNNRKMELSKAHQISLEFLVCCTYRQFR